MSVVAPPQPVHAPPGPNLVVAHALECSAYLATVLDELEDALAAEDQPYADALAALVVGVERDANMRAAMTVGLGGHWKVPQVRTWPALDERWRALRVRCRFPTERAVTAAVAELGAVPPVITPTKSTKKGHET